MKRIFFYLLTAILIASCDGGHDKHGGHNSSKFSVTNIDMVAKDFTLTNQDGEKYTLSDTKGSVVAITFTYTNCPNACPKFQKKFTAIQKRYFNRLGTDLHLLFVTVDPERDTVAVLKERSTLIGADNKGWNFLTGSKEEVQKVLDDYLVHVEAMKEDSMLKGEFVHPQRVYLINKAGVIETKVGGLEYDNSVLIEEIGKLL